MRLRIAAGLLAATMPIASCLSPPVRGRGQFSIVSNRALPGFEVKGVRARVAGEGCFSLTKATLALSDEALAAAVDEAISKVQGANALVLVEITDRGRCVEVVGWPIEK